MWVRRPKPRRSSFPRNISECADPLEGARPSHPLSGAIDALTTPLLTGLMDIFFGLLFLSAGAVTLVYSARASIRADRGREIPMFSGRSVRGSRRAFWLQVAGVVLAALSLQFWFEIFGTAGALAMVAALIPWTIVVGRHNSRVKTELSSG